MDLVRELVAHTPEDPVVLAGMVVAASLPICAVILILLGGVAALQNYLYRRPRGPRLLLMPPAEVRPLVTRRTITEHRSGNAVLDVTRLSLAVIAVLGFSALVIAAGGQVLLPALGR
jgi:hypothetical protein